MNETIIVNGARLRARLRMMTDNFKGVVEEIITLASNSILEDAQKTKLYTTRSPANGLRKNTILEHMQPFVRKIKANKHYAGWVEYGNDPGGGIIKPKYAKYLRFPGPNGEMLFRKSVKAAKPRPFMRDAYNKALQDQLKMVVPRMQRFIDTGK